MLGAQNAKTKHPVNLSPPKLQRIPKPDGADIQRKSPSRVAKLPSATSNLSSNVEKKEGTWFPQTENEFLQSHDGTIPKPAQNIALMGGKRYIVVPKNNAMAVQPAITVKPDKIGDKPPAFQDYSLADISNTVGNNIAKLSAPPPLPKQSSADVPEKVNAIPNKEPNKEPDKEITKDTANLVSSDTIAEITETLENKDTPPKKDELVENTLENELSLSTTDIEDTSESEKARTISTPSESKTVTLVDAEDTLNVLEASTQVIKMDRQQPLSSKANTVKVKNNK